MELLIPQPSEIALDVATGTGFTAMEIAPRVKQVLATDITENMLVEARKNAQARNLKNIRFEMADASYLPYPDSTFDLVTSRRAPHHFSNITKFLTEAHRVLRPGGRLGVSDMSPREGTEEFVNAIERMRDQSHAKALSPSEWRKLLASIGFEIKREERIYEEVSFEQWLYPVERGGTEELEIMKAWKNVPKRVRDLMRAKESKKGIERWSRSLIVLVASKYNHV